MDETMQALLEARQRVSYLRGRARQHHNIDGPCHKDEQGHDVYCLCGIEVTPEIQEWLDAHFMRFNGDIQEEQLELFRQVWWGEA